MTMAAYLGNGVEYPGRSAHVKSLLAYVRRCSRVKWEAGDLRNVCEFLDAVAERSEASDEAQLLEKLVRKGLKKFPDDPVFAARAGELELARGPFECDRRHAYRCFQRAAELAKDGNDPKAADAAERARRAVSFLEDVGVDLPPDDFRFGPPGGPLPGQEPDECSEPDYDPLDDVPPGVLFSMFVEACAEMGLDPEEVLDKAAAEGPIPMRLAERLSRARRKKKAKKKR
jgi:hypothetical protein